MRNPRMVFLRTWGFHEYLASMSNQKCKFYNKCSIPLWWRSERKVLSLFHDSIWVLRTTEMQDMATTYIFFFFFPKKFSEFHLGKHFLSVIPLECKLHEKNFQQFSSLLYFQHLEQGLANSRHLISICWINKWMNQCFLNKLKKHGT